MTDTYDFLSSDLKRRVITWTFEDDEGVEQKVVFPATMSICSRCDGRGVVDHEAFANGIPAEAFHEDPDFEEQYRRGDFDRPCPVCRGERVELEIDRDRVKDQDALRRLDEWIRDENETRATMRAERAAEEAFERRICGGRDYWSILIAATLSIVFLFGCADPSAALYHADFATMSTPDLVAHLDRLEHAIDVELRQSGSANVYADDSIAGASAAGAFEGYHLGRADRLRERTIEVRAELRRRGVHH